MTLETQTSTAGRRRRQPEPLLVFVHIPKTGGTTLAKLMHYHFGDAFEGGNRVSRKAPPELQAPNAFSRGEQVDARLREVAARPEVRALSGHITFGLRDRLPADARYVTVLRDPVERTLSHYRFFVDAPAGREERAGLGLLPPSRPRPSGSVTLEECLADGGYIPDNLQTRMLCGLVSPFDPLPAQPLAQAVENLRRGFAFVGTTERFDDLLALMNLELGWPTVGYRRSNRNPGYPRREDLAPEELRLVEERNALDRELHAVAEALLAEAVERVGSQVADEVAVIRGAAKVLEEPAGGRAGHSTADVRLLPLEARIALAAQEAELAEAQLSSARLRSKLERRKRR
jgi:hypothetical protein